MKRTFPLLSLLLMLGLMLGACGTADNESTIATAVALTVQAQATPTSEVFPSATPRAPATSPTSTALAVSPTVNPSISYANCMAAALVSENPPDKTVFVAGNSFLKTWRIQNNSDCTWTTDYKIIFWNGDLMGGAYSYNFPQFLPPGESADVSILLAAPDAAGTYRGEWKLQTPSGQNFGVGPSQIPFWTEIVVVGANETPTYGITSVTYDLERNPLTGCSTNNWYTVTAHVSFSGPMSEVILWFEHSDGGESKKIKLEITEATTMDFTDEWKFHIADAQGPKWIRLAQVFPTYIAFDKVNFTFECK
ncbi:MAG: hypothetical protein C4583_16515 [Anaerolineaceae bacterium]|nr:MAG: hypothetical protein C4583_16515 [Anaerolineaceae bacterium]